MQYVDVAIDHHAGNRLLTYSIPPVLLGKIAIGSVVRVPFGQSTVFGVSIRFSRRVDSRVRLKLKPLDEVVYAGNFVPTYVTQAAQSLQKQYGLSWHNSLFPLLPPFLKRPQPMAEAVPTVPGAGYYVQEYLLGLPERIDAYSAMYRKYAANQTSILVICPTTAAAVALASQMTKQGSECILFPAPHAPKTVRDYYLHARSNTAPRLYIGTRSALITPLQTVGAVILDELWLPGHKDERQPMFWSFFLAAALCRARGIPLYCVSCLPWPETRLLPLKKQVRIRQTLGTLTLLPKRPVEESVTHFLAQSTNDSDQSAIIMRPTRVSMYWCAACHTTLATPGPCPTCRRPLAHLPQLSAEGVKTVLAANKRDETIPILMPESMLTYRRYQTILVLGFDSFLSTVDYRSEIYLATLITLIRSQARRVMLVTSRPDEWTVLGQHTAATFTRQIETERKPHHLPPFYLPVELTAATPQALEAARHNMELHTIKAGPIKPVDTKFTQTLLLPSHANLPAAWQLSRTLKIDILPLYIDTPDATG